MSASTRKRVGGVCICEWVGVCVWGGGGKSLFFPVEKILILIQDMLCFLNQIFSFFLNHSLLNARLASEFFCFVLFFKPRSCGSGYVIYISLLFPLGRALIKLALNSVVFPTLGFSVLDLPNWLYLVFLLIYSPFTLLVLHFENNVGINDQKRRKWSFLHLVDIKRI